MMQRLSLRTRRALRQVAALGILVALSASLPGHVAARPHGLALTLEVQGEHRIVTATYASGAPASNADVVVRAPAEGGGASDGAPAVGSDVWQEGRTDPRGRFIFAPERPGEWQVVVDDGQGHRATLVVSVAAPSAEPEVEARARTAASSVAASEVGASPEVRSGDAAGGPIGDRFWQLVAGLGLIAGLTGGAYGIAARR